MKKTLASYKEKFIQHLEYEIENFSKDLVAYNKKLIDLTIEMSTTSNKLKDAKEALETLKTLE